MRNFILLPLTLLIMSVQVWADLPVLTLNPYAPIEDSVIKVKNLVHSIKAENKELTIHTTWWIDSSTIGGPLKSLKFLSISRDSLSVQRIMINNIAANWCDEATSDGVVGSVDVPSSVGTIRQIDIDYRFSADVTSADVVTISSQDLLSIAKIIRSPDRGLAFDLRKKSGLDFSEQIRTTARIEAPSSLIVFGSKAPKSKGKWQTIGPINAGRFVIGFADSIKNQLSQFSSSGTDFSVISKRDGSGLDVNLVKNIIKVGWPKYMNRFPRPSASVSLIEDFSMPVGAGPAGTNVLAFSVQKLVPDKIQEFLESNAGWPRFSTAGEYINWLYGKSNNPMIDYWTTIVMHELGHLFFGFEWTSERHPFLYDYWFSLGLGLLVDEQITMEMTGTIPSLYSNIIEYWQTRLAPMTTIDQRLVQPDVTQDQANGITSFNRLQHFGHAKALYVLREIRHQVGEASFDRLVTDYVRTGGTTAGYLGFRNKLLKLYPELPKLEAQLKIR